MRGGSGHGQCGLLRDPLLLALSMHAVSGIFYIESFVKKTHFVNNARRLGTRPIRLPQGKEEQKRKKKERQSLYTLTPDHPPLRSG